MKFLAIGACLLGLGAVTWARAEVPAAAEELSLPPDLGTLSIAAAKRALAANIQDWDDERAEIHGRRRRACARARAQIGLVMSDRPRSVLGLVERIPRHVMYPGSREPRGQGASAPLYAPLAELESAVALTEREKSVYLNLRERHVADARDALRLYIDLESFLAAVAGRLYGERIARHEGRAAAELCARYTLMDERARELSKSARRVVAYYRFLEQELGD